jgi:hypothetical protein
MMDLLAACLFVFIVFGEILLTKGLSFYTTITLKKNVSTEVLRLEVCIASKYSSRVHVVVTIHGWFLACVHYFCVHCAHHNIRRRCPMTFSKTSSNKPVQSCAVVLA